MATLYVLSNGSMPGLLKVGHTSRLLKERIAELNSATGVPTRFQKEYTVRVQAAVAARLEQESHALLTREGFHYGKEFFRCDVSDCKRIIATAIAELGIQIEDAEDGAETAKRIEAANRARIERIHAEELRRREAQRREKLVEEVRHTYDGPIQEARKPRISFLGAWFLCGIISAVCVSSFATRISGAGVLVAGVFFGFIGAVFLHGFASKRKEQSAEYQSLLKEREARIANILSQPFGDVGEESNARSGRSPAISQQKITYVGAPIASTPDENSHDLSPWARQDNSDYMSGASTYYPRGARFVVSETGGDEVAVGAGGEQSTASLELLTPLEAAERRLHDFHQSREAILQAVGNASWAVIERVGIRPLEDLCILLSDDLQIAVSSTATGGFPNGRNNTVASASFRSLPQFTATKGAAQALAHSNANDPPLKSLPIPVEVVPLLEGLFSSVVSELEWKLKYDVDREREEAKPFEQKALEALEEVKAGFAAQNQGGR